MKLFILIRYLLKSFFSLLVLFIVFTFQFNSQIVNAIAMDNYQNEFIVEELRLKIPSDYKDVWLEAEKNVWEEWLSKQDGFLGRQIFWNKEKEEALILVNWKNKQLWKNISMTEVNNIQKKFEDNVKKTLNTNINPFVLIYEGELDKQG